MGKIFCKSLGVDLYPGQVMKQKKTVLEHVQNGYNAIYTRLALDSRSCNPVTTTYSVFILLLCSLNLKKPYNVLVIKPKLLFVKCYYMLCLLPRYSLFRFNMAFGARIPRIFNHKRMLTSYLMAVSSILIKELFDIIDCLELFRYF